GPSRRGTAGCRPRRRGSPRRPRGAAAAPRGDLGSRERALPPPPGRHGGPWMSEHWRIRRADLGDLDAIMDLEKATFPADAWSRAVMEAELSSPHAYYLVATGDDGALDAYAGLLAPRGGGEGDIQTIAVAPRARGRGLGRALMNALIT